MPRSRPPVCRCLFGRPNPDEVDKFLQETNETFQREAELRWNFNFRAGCPVTDVDKKNQRYEWVTVDDGEAVPSAYSNILKSAEHSESTPVSADVTAGGNAVILHETSSASNSSAVNTSSSSSGSSTTTTTVSAAAADTENNSSTHCVDSSFNERVN